jgi:hypothetical protein
VTANTRLQVAAALNAAESSEGSRGRSRILPDGDPILMQLREVTDARLENPIHGPDQGCLPLRAGSHYPFDHTPGLVVAAQNADFEPGERPLINKLIPLIGFA